VIFFFACSGGRYDVTVTVSSNRTPNESHEILRVLGAIDSWAPQQGFYHLLDLDPVLRMHLKDISEASEARYPAISRSIIEAHEHDEVMRRQHQTEINRRLYGN
jgi:hypothetical protein